MPKVLVIDDDDAIRKFLTALLKKNGFDVVDAPDGLQGLKAFNSEGADIVITDLVMPDKEGLETIKDIKKLQPDIPIIAISGGGIIDPDTYLTLARNLGASCTFSKPLDRSKLIEKVKELTT